MPRGRWSLSRSLMLAHSGARRSGIEKGTFLSSVMTSRPRAVLMARLFWKRLMAYVSLGM